MEMTRAAMTIRPKTLSVHWPEVLMEALGLGLFMVSASVFGTIFEYPSSAVHLAVPNPFVRRALMGMAMGLTAIGLVYSPWGKRSGAHINPAFTLTLLRLGRVGRGDGAAYVVAQFIGGLAGTLLVAALVGDAFLAPPVMAVTTMPGPAGIGVAFGSELAISFALVLTVLTLGRSPRWARYTGLFVGCLICLYITLEAPLSGMSMNPARTIASAIPARSWQGVWVYFTAPLAGMLLASEVHIRLARSKRDGCAKIVHSFPCIFCGESSDRAS